MCLKLFNTLSHGLEIPQDFFSHVWDLRPKQDFVVPFIRGRTWENKYVHSISANNDQFSSVLITSFFLIVLSFTLFPCFIWELRRIFLFASRVSAISFPLTKQKKSSPSLQRGKRVFECGIVFELLERESLCTRRNEKNKTIVNF